MGASPIGTRSPPASVTCDPLSGPPQVSAAAVVSRPTGLLGGDALVVAVMRQHGLTHPASHDADFDRVPALTRYAQA